MQSEKIWANYGPQMFSGCRDTYSVWRARIILYFVNFMLVGFAEKGQLAEEKKAVVTLF